MRAQGRGMAKAESTAIAMLKAFFQRVAQLDSDASRISQSEFNLALDKVKMEDELARPDLLFAYLDVDHSGSIDLDEFLYALAERHLVRYAELDLASAFRASLVDVHDALVKLETAGKPIDVPSVSEVVKQRLQDAGKWHSISSSSSALTTQEWILTCCCPCSIGWSTFAGFLWEEESSVINGVEAMLSYVSACKVANLRYRWTIQNFKNENIQRQRQDNDGNWYIETKFVRTKTARAVAEGELQCEKDDTEPFTPGASHRTLGVLSNCSVEFEPAFSEEYVRRRQMFFAMNTSDVDCEVDESIWLPPMQTRQRYAWRKGQEAPEEPSCVMRLLMCAAALTPCTATAWLCAMKRSMGIQKLNFSKRAVGFTTDTPVESHTFGGGWSITTGMEV